MCAGVPLFEICLLPLVCSIRSEVFGRAEEELEMDGSVEANGEQNLPSTGQTEKRRCHFDFKSKCEKGFILNAWTSF